MGVKPNGERYLMPCKSWNCPVCAIIKKLKLMDQVNLYFRGDPEVYFYTFTEQADSGRDIMADLKSFKRTLKTGLKIRMPGTSRKWIWKWQPIPRQKSFWTKEFTKRGVRHIHMITTLRMTNEELSQRWRHATKGISDQARITENMHVKNPAGYMMKYMGKQLTEDREQFYEGEYQFKKGERRTGFWKPEGITEIPKLEIPEDLRQDPDDEITVELGHSWNQESKYYRAWYDDLYTRWGEPFHRFMEYSTLNEIQKAHIQGITEILPEIHYDYVPEDKPDNRELVKMWKDYQQAKADLILTRESIENIEKKDK